MSATDLAAALPSACLNCEQPLGSPRPRYCPACGQETNVRAPGFGEFMQQFGGAYFATEGALWRTARLLLFKPGELTRQYLAGRRKHYVLPLRLFLSCSVIMLLALRIAGLVNFATLDDEAIAAALPERPRLVHLELGFGQAGLAEGRFYCEGLPAWACKRLRTKFDVDTRAMVQQMQIVNDRVVSNTGTMMLLLMPVFALGLSLLYRNRDLRFTEHLVFSLHLHAFWSLVVTAMAFEVDLITVLGLAVIPAYGLLAMRAVYGGRWHWLLLRAALLAPAHLALVGSAAVAVTLMALLLR